jgi:DNA polymerase III sliding clamp (beta) subunit (PCNA family)
MHLKTYELKSALDQLKPVVAKISMLPILSCVHIQAGADMRLSVADGDQFASLTIEFDGEVADFLVNFTQLSYSLAECETTTFLFEPGAIIVKCGEKTTKLATADAAEFPPGAEMKGVKEVGVNLADVAAGIRAVHGFEHKDRYPLNYLSIIGTPKSLNCSASDGANCAHNAAPLICASFEALIPPAFAESLADALEMPEARFKLSDRIGHVEWDGGFYQCKLGEGAWPSIKVFTDQEIKFIGMLEVKPLMAELQSCLAFQDQAKAPAINFEFTKKELFTSFTGTNSKLENKFMAAFEPYKCTLNAASMLKCLGAFDQSCKIYGNERMVKMESGDLTAFSALMLEK